MVNTCDGPVKCGRRARVNSFPISVIRSDNASSEQQL